MNLHIARHPVEAAELYDLVSKYKVLQLRQLLMLYPGREEIAENLVTTLAKRKRLVLSRDRTEVACSQEWADKGNPRNVLAFWAMLDFSDKIEVHYPGTDGVTIFAYGENSEYDFITILPGEEYLVSRQISHQREGLSNHLIVVLQDREQIKKVDIPEVSAFCVVAEDGSTEYLSYRKGETYDSN